MGVKSEKVDDGDFDDLERIFFNCHPLFGWSGAHIHLFVLASPLSDGSFYPQSQEGSDG